MARPERREKSFYRGTLYRDDLEELFAIFEKYGGCTISYKRKRFASPADFFDKASKKPFSEMTISTNTDSRGGATATINRRKTVVDAYCVEIESHEIYFELVEHLNDTTSFVNNPNLWYGVSGGIIGALIAEITDKVSPHPVGWRSILLVFSFTIPIFLCMQQTLAKKIYALREAPEQSFITTYRDWIIGVMWIATTLFGIFYQHK